MGRGAVGPALVQVQVERRGSWHLPSQLHSRAFHFCVIWGLILASVRFTAGCACAALTLTQFRGGAGCGLRHGAGEVGLGAEAAPGRHHGVLGAGFWDVR